MYLQIVTYILLLLWGGLGGTPREAVVPCTKDTPDVHGTANPQQPCTKDTPDVHGTANPQQPCTKDTRSVHGEWQTRRQMRKDWDKAAQRIEQHREEWYKIFETLDADAQECEAIIFPEQLRYSKLQNGMEEGATIALYAKGGTAAANFSVGYFQMKPSFAEEVEKAWMLSPLRHRYKLYFNTQDTFSSRQKRLERILDPQWQCVYLGAFYRLLIERIPELEKMQGRERVILMATAYNRDFDAPLEQLQLMKEDWLFHTDIFPSENTEYHSYGEIAGEWYQQITQKN